MPHRHPKPPHWSGWGRSGGWQHGDLPPTDDAAGWLAGRLPEHWFTGPPEVLIDRDEIIVIGRLPEPKTSAGASDVERTGAERGRIARFREETRDQRIQLAQQIEHRYRRRVSWGAASGGTQELFTNLAAPVMTRLRQPERRVLDTLVDAGVARSRSDALAWCVRLVGQHAEQWLAELRKAMSGVDELRKRGPEIPEDLTPEPAPDAPATETPEAPGERPADTV